MTAGGDFIPPGEMGVVEPSYPVVFGIRLTPTVNGILVALLGMAGAIWLLLNVLQPAWQTNQELKRDIAEKEQQLVDQGQVEQQIADAQQRRAEAEQLRADVLALFASEDGLETLLLDVNERVQAANAGVTPGRVQEGSGDTLASRDARATLTRFEVVPSQPGMDGVTSDVVTDSSFGPEVNGQLRQRVYVVEMLGTFAQTQSIIRNIERLQPLLVVRDFRSEIDGTERVIVNEQGQLTGTFEPRLRTSFRMIALIPLEPQVQPPPVDPEADPNAAPTVEEGVVE
ncbi:MAG: hypothetical protein KME20_22375 [Kaiparowitsia implicata GSE-PSE-MK54-09C]|jgi:type IV pilus assembly protein PilO|nr:hypothetical protein [Kaiparowitsia implicata GSE-PSE-MK54-09C]